MARNRTDQLLQYQGTFLSMTGDLFQIVGEKCGYSNP